MGISDCIKLFKQYFIIFGGNPLIFFFFFFQNIKYFLQSLNIVSRKEIFWIHEPFNFRNMSTIAGWSFTEAGDGIGGILAILDNNMLIPIAAIERFRN